MQILQSRRIPCGKGEECTILDLRIQNPEERSLWLLVDARNNFSGYLDSVEILHAKYSPSPPVWAFSGQFYHQAFKVPPDADIIVRNVEYSRTLDEVRAVFFDHIALNYDHHIDWTDGGTMPARGDFDMRWLRSEHESKRFFELEGQERVSLEKWCTYTVPVSKEPTNDGHGQNGERPK